MNKGFRKKIDFILLASVLILISLGCLILFSISASLAQENCGNTYCFLEHQFLLGIGPGIVLGFAAYRINLKLLKKWSLPLFVFSLILMAMVFAPGIGFSRGEAHRWLRIGPLSFQPSELLKIALPLYLSAWLVNNKKKDLTSFLLFLAILFLPSLILIFQPDISTLFVLISAAFLIYFLAETPLWHTFLTVAIAGAGILFLIYLAPYRMERLLVFLEPQLDPMGIGYQIKQAQIAVGAGGIFGQGLGMSGQKFGILPHPMSDSIFAVFAEEGGLVGSIILIIVFLIFFHRGIKIAREANNQFCQLLASGLVLQIIFQAFLNIGSMIGILPLTGIPLPFISYGGTHMVIELISVGILLNISNNL